MSDHEDCSTGRISATHTQDLHRLSFLFQSLLPALSCDQKKKKINEKNICKNITEMKKNCLPQSANNLKLLQDMNSSSSKETAVESTDGQTMYSKTKGR